MELSLNSLERHSRAVSRRRLLIPFLLVAWLAVVCPLRAVIQFDVFLGYDGVVPLAAWFPMVCEVRNDEASFSGFIVISPGSFGQGPERRFAVELPTGTLKRVVLPSFATSRGVQSWDARLYDSRGRVRAETLDIQARRQPGPTVPVLGAISRTAGGSPTFKSISASLAQMQPLTVELQPAIFPDMPLVLEGLDALYLNSERAADLKPTQIQAILTWIETGGHLIIGVEQASDFRTSPWLGNLTAFRWNEFQVVPLHPELHDYLRGDGWNTNFLAASVFNPTPGRRQFNPDVNPLRHPFEDLAPDPVFEAAPLRVMTGDFGKYRTLLTSSGHPLVVMTQKGRGKVTCLLANPEREPMRSWKHLSIFWACLADVPLQYYSENIPPSPGGWSSDAIYGSLVETRQVRKLPVGWLLLLLLVYLAVIGPLDRYWLKRLRRPSLTWVTFPCYVVLFSGLIYFIGFKLRAGESEWGELNIVDILGGRGMQPLARGRTYGSLYSPANQRYPLASSQRLSALRSEFSGAWAGQASAESSVISQAGEGFNAEVSVPVWSSRLFVADWYDQLPGATRSHLRQEGKVWMGEIENLTPRELPNVMLAVGDTILDVGPIAARQKKSVSLAPGQGIRLGDFVAGSSTDFNVAVTYRRRAFGQREMNLAQGPAALAMAASFLQHPSAGNLHHSFQQPTGLELSPFLNQGGAVVLAWDPDQAPFPALLRITPRRMQRHTLWRELIRPATEPSRAESSAEK